MNVTDAFVPQYELERQKYARDLIDFDKKFSKLFSGKPRTDTNQDGVSHEEFLECVPVLTTTAVLYAP